MLGTMPWGVNVGAAALVAMDTVQSKAAAVSVPTGFAELDGLTGGLRPGDVWVVSGRSGVGKSVFARDLLRAAALRQRQACLLVSRVEPPGEVALTLLAAEARVPLHHLAGLKVTEEESSRLELARAGLSDAPLVLSHTGDPDLARLQGRLDDLNRNSVSACAVVVIDDLPAGPGQWRGLRAARGLATSRELAAVVVVQEDLDDVALQGLRIEQLADVALRLERDDQGNPDSPRAGEADVVVIRNRRGPTATITLAFQGHYGRFVDLPR